MFSELNNECVQMCCILGKHVKTPCMPFTVLSNMRFRNKTSTYLRCFSGCVTFLSKLSNVVIRRETVSSPRCAFFPSSGSNRRNSVSLVEASQTSSVALERITRSRGPKLLCFAEPNLCSRYSRMAGICGRSKQLP
jgi:hypothetical protein